MKRSSYRNGVVSKPLRWCFGLLTTLLLGLGLSGTLGVAAAGASGTYHTTISGLRVHTGPHLGDPIIAGLGYYSSVTIDCQSYGDNVYGTTVWDHLVYPTLGWVTDYYVSTPVYAQFTYGLPRCGSAPPPPTPPSSAHAPPFLQRLFAASKAVSMIGQIDQPAGTEFAGRSWSGYCDHFDGVAYGRWASGHATALDHWNYLRDAGLAHPGDMSAPMGALVFYNLSLPDGHTAVALGNGVIVTTPASSSGRVYPTLIGHFGNYLGWAWPDSSWTS